MPFEIVRNDITRMETDAIVNAANASLLGGGGVDGAIHRAAGPRLLEACRALGGCRTGEAKATPGFDLPCRWVIHTVGPIWEDGRHGEEALLASCYRNSLRLAKELRCESVAFPLISAGAYGYPREEALRVATEAIRAFLLEEEMRVVLVVFDKASFAISKARYDSIQSFIDDSFFPPEWECTEARRRPGANLSVPFEKPLEDSKPPKAAPRRTESRSSEPRYCSSCGRRMQPGLSFCAYCGAADRDGAVECAATPSVPPPAPSVMPKPSKAKGPSGAGVPGAGDAKVSDRVGTTYREEAYISLDDYLRKMDEGFRDMLLRKIDERGMTDAECYKQANVDRKLFNKIKNQTDYRPGKSTVLAFAVALRLPMPEIREMLMKAGYSLSHSSKFDLIVEYYIKRGCYDVYEINEALFAFDQRLLGSAV